MAHITACSPQISNLRCTETLDIYCCVLSRLPQCHFFSPQKAPPDKSQRQTRIDSVVLIIQKDKASWPNINPAMNCLHKHSYGVSTLCTLFQHCSDFECPAAISSNQAERSTGVIHLKSAVLGMMVQPEKTDQTTETCANSTSETTNGSFLLHVRKKRNRPVLRQQIQTLSPLSFIMQSVTPATHTHLPLLLHANTQFASTKYHLQCSEGADEKDSSDMF